MKQTGVEKIQAKKAARIWLISAAQSVDLPLNKNIGAEIKRLLRRLRRDVKSLNRAEADLEADRQRKLAVLVDSQKRDIENRKIKFVKE